MGILKKIATLLYPPRCILCRKILKLDGICYPCREKLRMSPNGRCVSPSMVDVSYAPLYYKDSVRRAIIRYKFYNTPGYAKIFAEFMTKCLEDYSDCGFDYVTWVPISTKRLHKRGYDQSKLLAKEIAAYFQLPLIHCMNKIRDNPPQSKQFSREMRRSNVLGAYALCNTIPLNGKRILLVDDILTTGATLGECARMLKTAGAKYIYSVVIAKTEISKKKN